MKHDWVSLDKYLSSHERVLTNYSWAVPPHYVATSATSTALELNIERATLITQKSNEIFVKIYKLVEIDDTTARKKAKTEDYTYHAWEPRNGLNLIRYCSPDEHGSNHHKFHHKHTYDISGSDTVKQIGPDDWPHVNEFLDEVSKTF